MRWLLRILAVTFLLAAGMGQAQQAPKRLALVIGNGGYTSPGWALANPPRDARLIAERLRGLGFEVDLIVDADRSEMVEAIDSFGTKLKRAGNESISFFYYAGHGAQKDGANYLVPVDANATTMDRLRLDSPPMQFLLDYMIETGNAVNILVLDACRNLPLPEGQRTLGGEGLADLGKPQNFFVAYATAPGRTAADGVGQNSPFAAALAAALERQADEPIALMFSDVNNRVFRATDGGQSPEYRDGLVRAPRWSLAADRVPPLMPTTPGTEFKDCEVCPKMVVLPAGTFLMGSPETEAGRDEDEGPQRRVTIARPFAVGKFEVTFAEWDACVAAGGCAPEEEGPYRPDDRGWGRGDHPVILVSWQDAKRYIRWLNGKVGGRAYRLLTEAEWEYAARAGSTTAYSTGAAISPAQTPQFWEQRTAPVGSFPANSFKLHDMHGNVWELVEDCHKSNYSGLATDGSANVTEGCSNRVMRGGSSYFLENLRSASRGWQSPSQRTIDVGFRVARTSF